MQLEKFQNLKLNLEETAEGFCLELGVVPHLLWTDRKDDLEEFLTVLISRAQEAKNKLST